MHSRKDIEACILPNGVRRTTIVKDGAATTIDVMPDGNRRITRPDGRTHALPPLRPPVVIVAEGK